ncbi:MAG: hypothetical protein ACFCU8_22070 [Thermosynechococcaceae cyanobacterium]
MSHQQDWQFSTVQEFLRQCNWQGTQRPAASAPDSQNSSVSTSPTPSTFRPQPTSWQCQTVQGFLSRGNWDGCRQLASAPPLAMGSPEPSVETGAITFTSTLPVGQFFEFFTWEAQPEIGAIPKLNSPDRVTDDSDLNLSDLSDLF